MLQKNEDRYNSLLKEPGQCVEMGIRVILDVVRQPKEAPRKEFLMRERERGGSGQAYLAGRKAHHDVQALAMARNEESIEHCRSPLEVLFVSFKAETSKIRVCVSQYDSVLMSVYYLVPRMSEDSFRKACGDLKSREATKTMFSGPWPPYNFVLPEDYSSKHRDARFQAGPGNDSFLPRTG